MRLLALLFYPALAISATSASPASDWWAAVVSGHGSSPSGLCIFGADTVAQANGSRTLAGVFGWALLQQLPVDSTLSAAMNASGSIELHYSGHVALQGLFYFNDSAGAGSGDVFAESIILRGLLSAPASAISNLTTSHMLPAGVYTFNGSIELTNFRSIVDMRPGACGVEMTPAPTPASGSGSSGSTGPYVVTSAPPVAGSVLLVLLIVCGLSAAMLGLFCWLSLLDTKKD
jgi:hypothetical protein